MRDAGVTGEVPANLIRNLGTGNKANFALMLRRHIPRYPCGVPSISEIPFLDSWLPDFTSEKRLCRPDLAEDALEISAEDFLHGAAFVAAL